ncbi:MAG: hypothetical protein NZ988_05770 [Thaumarchaeota archaeon]|nr:hypothetical protein [Candidatus Calditenuaceae archaeon]MDW8187530.1 hypothetical protein [Nitrososphaerota archaeon]
MRRRTGVSTTVQTAVLIAITAALAVAVVALWRPWEASGQAQSAALSAGIQQVHDLLLRREGATNLAHPVIVRPFAEAHAIEIEWKGRSVFVPAVVSTIEYVGPKQRIPGIYYLDRGEVDVLGSYVASNKLNYTTTGLDVVTYAVYTDREVRVVTKALPYISFSVDRVYNDVMVTVIVRVVYVTPYPANLEAFRQVLESGYVVPPGNMLTFRTNATRRTFYQLPESIDGGALRVFVDGQQVPQISFSTDEKAVLRVFVDYVTVTVWAR